MKQDDKAELDFSTADGVFTENTTSCLHYTICNDVLQIQETGRLVTEKNFGDSTLAQTQTQFKDRTDLHRNLMEVWSQQVVLATLSWI